MKLWKLCAVLLGELAPWPTVVEGSAVHLPVLTKAPPFVLIVQLRKSEGKLEQNKSLKEKTGKAV